MLWSRPIVEPGCASLLWVPWGSDQTWRLAMRRHGTSVVLVFVVALTLVAGLIVAVPVAAQVAGATLSGTVTDSSGAVLPTAQIVVKARSTGVVRSTSTDSGGFYSVPNLAAGTYQVS